MNKEQNEKGFYDKLMSFGDRYYEDMMVQLEPESKPESEPEPELEIEITKTQKIILSAILIYIAIDITYSNIDKIKEFMLKFLTPQTYIDMFKEPIFQGFIWFLFISFIIANFALLFYKKRYELGFKLIRSLITSVFVIVFYVGVFAILYVAFENKKLIILVFIGFFIIVSLIVFMLNFKKKENFNDKDDFLISYLTQEDEKPKTHLSIAKEFFILFLTIMFFAIFKKVGVFSGKGGDFGGGGSSGKAA
ncbi:hypothetical protein [Campylobacter sp. RM16188]|uniref:hypothetical protein n=1 Tax=Campylobacter sp. RM16188 TaxID=1705725 RepID=UPI001555EED2|nr:hypothetical protein [Campylobacter sp. RM16188]